MSCPNFHQPMSNDRLLFAALLLSVSFVEQQTKPCKSEHYSRQLCGLDVLKCLILAYY